MHLQILSSGSAGNCCLVRAGETYLLVDCGLELDDLYRRLEIARVAPQRIDHVALTHGHLDHARSSGAFSRAHDVTLHCAEALMSNRSVRRAARLDAFTVGRPNPLASPRGEPELQLRPVQIPHDADPTVAFRLEHADRVAVIVTDMGRPAREAVDGLAGAHLLVLEFNHDAELLARGPYPHALKRRVGGPMGHLSNEQACTLLGGLAGPNLHTLVLAHLSRTNNTPALAQAAASQALEDLGRADVRVLVAEQDSPGPNLEV